MKEEKKIIAVDPDTRYQGIAIFQGKKLIFSSVKTLHAKGPLRKRLKEIEKVFFSLIEDYAPNVLAIERPFPFRTEQSSFLGAIIDEIKRLARKERIRVHEFSPLAVRKIIYGNADATKQDVAEKVSLIYPELKNRIEKDPKSDYPELKNRLNQDRKSFHSNLKIRRDEDKQKNEDKKQKLKEGYWGHMFDAVGLGVCYLKTRQKL
jgi:Holliday junction resolvasome RuvABC endonuclease subunit